MSLPSIDSATPDGRLRDRYIDLLRGMSLIIVVVWHWGFQLVTWRNWWRCASSRWVWYCWQRPAAMRWLERPHAMTANDILNRLSMPLFLFPTTAMLALRVDRASHS
jgi:hypothetical protein